MGLVGVERDWWVFVQIGSEDKDWWVLIWIGGC